MSDKIDGWKDRFQEIVSSCQVELKKTAEIGRKMIAASKANSDLNDCYQDLGKYFYQEIKNNKIQLDDPNVEHFVSRIEKFQMDLASYEEQVKRIKDQRNS